MIKAGNITERTPSVLSGEPIGAHVTSGVEPLTEQEELLLRAKRGSTTERDLDVLPGSDLLPD
jgi:hypothetical protein